MASRRGTPQVNRREKTSSTVWHRASPEDVGRVTVDTVNQLATDQAYRRDLAKRRLSIYLGRDVESLTADLYYSRKTDPLITQSYAQSVCDTAQANIACKQRPKAQALTKGGDYYQQLEAEKISKFMEGCLHEPQGGYSNTWEVGDHCFHDSEIFEAGVMYVYGDQTEGKFCHERCFAHELFVDPLDARAGSPRSLFHMHVVDKWELIDRFPDKRESIMSAALHRNHKFEVLGGRTSDLVTVYKAWRLRGRHVIAVDTGHGKGTLLDVPWERKSFPFAFIRWQRNAFGFWGQPIVDQIAASQEQANAMLQSIVENAEANAGGYTEYLDGAYEESDLQSALPNKLIKRKQGEASSLSVGRPPLYHPQVLDTFQLLKGACYELPGWSELSTQGRKEQSITSGVAIRTVNDMQDERHLARARAYEQFYVTVGRLDLEEAQAMADAGINPSTVIPNEGFLDTIDWGEITLPSDQFEVTIQASSANEDTVAARRQTIMDLIQMQYLDPAVGEQLLTTPNPDVESLTKRESAQRRYLDKVIARFSRYRPEKEERGDVFVPPDPLMSLPQAIMQMTDGYMTAREREAPEQVLALFRDYITFAQEMIKKAQPAPEPQPAAPPAGMPPQMGPGAPMPGPGL
jgi:hypothetical protein